MAYVNEYRQFDPYAQPGFIKSAANPAEQGAYIAGAAQGARAAYEANQRRLAAEQAYNAQQQAAGPSTYSNANALKAELQQNQAEIAKLQQELKEINGKYGDQDNMDRILAANRARVGDMGNSRAHQQDIQNRMQWRWQMDRINGAEKSSQKKAEVKALVEKLDSAYSEFAWADTDPQKQVAQNKINRLNKEYEELTGETFPNPFEAPTGVPKSGEQAKTLETAWGKLQASFDKNGRPTQAAIDEFLEKDAVGLPFSKELMDKINEAKQMTTQEKAANDKAEKVKKQKAAFDSYLTQKGKRETIEDLMKDKKDGDTLTETLDGETITIKKNWNDTTGRYGYEVSCGKNKKVL